MKAPADAEVKKLVNSLPCADPFDALSQSPPVIYFIFTLRKYYGTLQYFQRLSENIQEKLRISPIPAGGRGSQANKVSSSVLDS